MVTFLETPILFRSTSKGKLFVYFRTTERSSTTSIQVENIQ